MTATIDKADRGRVGRFFIRCEGFMPAAVTDPATFGQILDNEMARLTALLVEVREDERRRVGKMLGEYANRIFNKQDQDYPSNTLDKVAAHLRSGEPLVLGPVPA